MKPQHHFPPGIPVGYSQGGYDFQKLKTEKKNKIQQKIEELMALIEKLKAEKNGLE